MHFNEGTLLENLKIASWKNKGKVPWTQIWQHYSSRKTVASYIFLANNIDNKQNTVSTVIFSATFNCLLWHSFSNCALGVFFDLVEHQPPKTDFFTAWISIDQCYLKIFLKRNTLSLGTHRPVCGPWPRTEKLLFYCTGHRSGYRI